MTTIVTDKTQTKALVELSMNAINDYASEENMSHPEIGHVYAEDRADVLQIIEKFQNSSNLTQFMKDIDKLDTIVRESMYPVYDEIEELALIGEIDCEFEELFDVY